MREYRPKNNLLLSRHKRRNSGKPGASKFTKTRTNLAENGTGHYKLSIDEQMEAIRLIQVEKKSQGYVAQKYKVDRSTISRMMTEIRLKEELKGRLP